MAETARTSKRLMIAEKQLVVVSQSVPCISKADQPQLLCLSKRGESITYQLATQLFDGMACRQSEPKRKYECDMHQRVLASELIVRSVVPAALSYLIV
jgi:hypothetical protein